MNKVARGRKKSAVTANCKKSEAFNLEDLPAERLRPSFRSAMQCCVALRSDGYPCLHPASPQQRSTAMVESPPSFRVTDRPSVMARVTAPTRRFFSSDASDSRVGRKNTAQNTLAELTEPRTPTRDGPLELGKLQHGLCRWHHPPREPQISTRTSMRSTDASRRSNIVAARVSGNCGVPLHAQLRSIPIWKDQHEVLLLLHSAETLLLLALADSNVQHTC